MRSRRLLTRQAVLVSGMLLTAGACSFIYDLDKVQCEVPDDCAGFDEPSAQKGLACVEGVCTYLYPVTTTTGSPTSTTGSAGAGGTPECTENDDCIEKLGNPAICRNDECIELYSDECPIVLGEGTNFANLKSPKEPFIFGAYAAIGVPIPEYTAATANYEYAIDQVNKKTSGGYSYAGAQRPFIAVVCNDVGDIEDSMTHLVKTLEVPGIISTLSSARLLEAFQDKDYGARPNNVFVLSTTFADSTLTNPDVDPDDLLWHMLGNGEDQAAAYKPLVAQSETYLRAQRSIPEEQPIRIVMVVSDDPYFEDVASVITNTIVFNGKGAIANASEDCGDGEPCFVRVNIDAATTENPMPDLREAYNTIFTLEPQLVLAITRGEFFQDGLMPSVETAWDGAKAARELPPPFYLFSPRMPRNAMLAVVRDFEEPPTDPGNPAFLPLRQRILGVTPSGAEDTTLYDKYIFEFKEEYSDLPETVNLDGTENFYDAAFFMMYAIHGGAKINNLTGVDVSSGMTRLLGGGMDYNVGLDDAVKIIDELRLGGQDRYITLQGTMGPPDFRPSGARVNLPSIYCIDLDPEGTDDAMAFYGDVLRYDPDDETLSSPTGEDPCSIDGFLGEP